MGFQAVQSVVPLTGDFVEPDARLGELLGLEGETGLAALPAARDQSGGLQHPQVLGDRLTAMDRRAAPRRRRTSSTRVGSPSAANTAGAVSALDMGFDVLRLLVPAA
jgi:hypothetical protein